MLKLAIETALQEPRPQRSGRWPITVCIIAVALATAFYLIDSDRSPTLPLVFPNATLWRYDRPGKNIS
jgi:hypothetical protein